MIATSAWRASRLSQRGALMKLGRPIGTGTVFGCMRSTPFGSGRPPAPALPGGTGARPPTRRDDQVRPEHHDPRVMSTLAPSGRPGYPTPGTSRHWLPGELAGRRGV